jgi:branched-chain amino acid transport system substrate-binding protein
MAMKTTASIVLPLVVAMGGAGAAPAFAQEKSPITIGFATASTGFVTPYDDGVKTAEMAIEVINAKGGLLGRKLVSVHADTKSDRAEGAKAGLDVIQKGASLVVVTCDYDYGSPAALAAQKAGILTFSLCAGDAKFGVQGIGPLAFTPNVAAAFDGAAAAEFAYEKKQVRRPFVLLDNRAEFNKSV